MGGGLRSAISAVAVFGGDVVAGSAVGMDTCSSGNKVDTIPVERGNVGTAGDVGLCLCCSSSCCCSCLDRQYPS